MQFGNHNEMTGTYTLTSQFKVYIIIITNGDGMAREEGN